MSAIIWLVAASALLGGLFIAAVEFSGGAQTTGLPLPHVDFEQVVADAEDAIADGVGVFESGIDAVSQLLPARTAPPPEESVDAVPTQEPSSLPVAAIDDPDAAAPPSAQPHKPLSDARPPDDPTDQPAGIGAPPTDVEAPAAVQSCHVVAAGDSRLLSTISVADSAVSTHLKHGDTLGRCEQ